MKEGELGHVRWEDDNGPAHQLERYFAKAASAKREATLVARAAAQCAGETATTAGGVAGAAVKAAEKMRELEEERIR